MARARERAPKLTTTVISTTRSAGRDITMRAILGRRPAASSGARIPTRARTRSVAMQTSCRSGRTPASTSTITTASCRGRAPTGPAAKTAGTAKTGETAGTGTTAGTGDTVAPGDTFAPGDTVAAGASPAPGTRSA